MSVQGTERGEIDGVSGALFTAPLQKADLVFSWVEIGGGLALRQKFPQGCLGLRRRAHHCWGAGYVVGELGLYVLPLPDFGD